MDKAVSIIELRRQALDGWDSELYIIGEAHAVIQSLRRKGGYSMWLDQILHGLTWHHGLHTPHWIVENKEIVRRYARYEELSEDERKQLKIELIRSVRSLKGSG